MTRDAPELAIRLDEPVRPYTTFRILLDEWEINLRRTSGTWSYGFERGRRGDRVGKPSSGISGAALQQKTVANMRRVLYQIVLAVQNRWGARRFLKEMPGLIHHGLPYGQSLRALRAHETGTNYGCPASEVPRRWREFREEFATRLDRDDPIELAAFAEREIRFAIHPLADGCGRLATATAAWILLRAGHRIPTNAIVERYQFHAALRLPPDEFVAFYRANCIRREDADALNPFVRAAAS